MARRFGGVCCVLIGLLFSVLAEAEFDVRDYGAKGDGEAIDSDAINRAIEAAYEAGGGTVLVPAGEYLCYTLRLRSRVTLHLDSGSTIVAANSTAFGGPGDYDVPEENSWDLYQDFGHTYWRNSLIWGDGLEDIAISGTGRIYGRGLNRGDQWPEGASFNEEIVPGPFGYPNKKDRLPDGIGNKAIALKNCRNVLLRDFSILEGGHFGILATGVDNLVIDNLMIDTNRDGIDVDACSNVRISNCSVNAPWDDAICLKSSFALGYRRVTENVTIENCFVSGFDIGSLLDGTRTRKAKGRKAGPIGRIKFGTEANGGFRNVTISNCVFEYCRGLALEQVDGGILENVTVSNLVMRDIGTTPIFIRLGARLRAPEGTEVGSVKGITISNVVARNIAMGQGILIAGLAEHPIEDVQLSNLQFYFAGGGSKEQAKRIVPEYERDYPEPIAFGILPSWGIFARHVTGLKMRDIDLSLQSPDERWAAWIEDVDELDVAGVRLRAATSSKRWELREVRNAQIRYSDGLE